MDMENGWSHVLRYPLLDALRDRRSRRFGLGMKLPSGPLAHESREPGLPLTDEEEALLAFAACGLSGPALAEFDYAPAGGGTIMAGLIGRTIASGDAIQTVSLVVTNEDGTWLLKQPRDLAPDEVEEVAGLARSNAFVELYQKSRVRIAAGRTAPPLEPLFNLKVNEWSLYDRASTYFLPVNELTLLYINGLLEVFSEPTAAFAVDERRSYRPAGVGKFARSRGGHLQDDPKKGLTLTIQQVETLVTEFVTIEQGMMIQNLSLMTQALGLGGFPHWAAHAFGWLQALGFRMREIPSTRFLGMGWALRSLARLLGRDVSVPLAEGLEVEGRPLLTPYCPPWFDSMEDAVRAVVELKYGPDGIFRAGARQGAWKDPDGVSETVQEPSQTAVDAAIAYCEYIHDRYGRFPAYAPPFRTVLGFQAGHVDPAFYERHYRPGALSETQLNHMERWHSGRE